MINKESFIKGLESIFKSYDIEQTDDNIVLSKTYTNLLGEKIEKYIIATIPYDEIDNFKIEEDHNFIDNMLIFNSNIEVPVELKKGSVHSLFRRLDKYNYSVNEHGYEIALTRASQKYIMSLICNESDSLNKEFALSLYNFDEIANLKDFCDSFGILTVNFKSEKPLNLAEAKKMIQSYLFNITYNENLVLNISTFLDKSKRIISHTHRSGQFFPYKHYKQDLINYYYQGLCADMPFTQYLAFYHIIEFYFQNISEENILNEITSAITTPGFSPYKKETIKQFYNKIKKKMADQKEDGVWNEKNALLLCLRKFIVDISDFKISIDTIDSSSIDYYKNNEVSFADDGCKINFDISQDDAMVQIRNRVYAVRNAIVHSKEGEKLKYEPFKHDKDLQKEIPLIRAIAESVIINSAQKINL